jgi:hypothetical protein
LAPKPEGACTLKLCRIDDDRVGVVEGSTVRDVSAMLERLRAC